MSKMLLKAGLQIADELVTFLETEALAGLDIRADVFWAGLADLCARFEPENARLLERRDALQEQIDAWHIERVGARFDPAAYRDFLERIGYLVDEPAAFEIDPANVDAEIATRAGPQLVVPVLNARFLLNAANARWGSLYDALYGTDALDGPVPVGGYDATRGARAIAWGRDFLDQAVPLAHGSWADIGAEIPPLANSAQLVGRRGDNLLFRNNGLHIELVIDPSHAIGSTDPAGIADIVLEAALTTIVDLEDSVAVVDAQDKVAAYRNWLGLMRGDLEANFAKGGRTLTRKLEADRIYRDAEGRELILPGRSLLMVRNVGHLMTTPVVRLTDGRDAPEGILDAVVTSLIACHDLRRSGRFMNSHAGSIYIVKPKMHGPDEAAFTNRLFDAVEDLLGLARHTIKVGVMDEERRTSANLAATIFEVRHRLMFINTGFLDRTGDEIHTSMQAGAMLRKGDMKSSEWIAAYEDRNVQIGLACGLSGRAQIGKGMWAAPDRMADMLDQKIGHPKSGATTAWVPSPTAATLHATHYHRIDVFERHQQRRDEQVASLDRLLSIPLAEGRNWSPEEVRDELENNAQGILGYVVRWIDQGIGCSKVPDIHDVGLMEDRATLRISSQHMANWILHGVASPEDADGALARMAAKVDAQNADDPLYRPMAGHSADSLAYQAARALVFEGRGQPNGYTEPLLHKFRQRVKTTA